MASTKWSPSIHPKILSELLVIAEVGSTSANTPKQPPQAVARPFLLRPSWPQPLLHLLLLQLIPRDHASKRRRRFRRFIRIEIVHFLLRTLLNQPVDGRLEHRDRRRAPRGIRLLGRGPASRRRRRVRAAAFRAREGRRPLDVEQLFAKLLDLLAQLVDLAELGVDVGRGAQRRGTGARQPGARQLAARHRGRFPLRTRRSSKSSDPRNRTAMDMAARTTLRRQDADSTARR